MVKRVLIALLLGVATASAQQQPPRKFSALYVHKAAESACACKIDGVSLGKLDDKSTWRIDFAEGVTEVQRQTARQAVLNFDLDEYLKGR
jgi:outer membrane PBP1 activator LpoA protein